LDGAAEDCQKQTKYYDRKDQAAFREFRETEAELAGGSHWG
jgi:hypothetical protein